MADNTTMDELFQLAIEAEKAAETIYRRLAAKFAHHQEIADFWTSYAEQEVVHARWLAQIRDSASPEQLSAPADPRQVENVPRALQFSVEKALAGVHDLEDACQLANGLENSEVNTVFEFLIENFASDETAKTFLRSQLETMSPG